MFQYMDFDFPLVNKNEAVRTTAISKTRSSPQHICVVGLYPRKMVIDTDALCSAGEVRFDPAMCITLHANSM